MGFRRKGVPSGYRENWAYHGRWSEKKIRPGLWKGTYTATKRRRANSYGNFGKGTFIKWKLYGYQTAVKVGKGIYQTVFKFYKRPVKVKVRRTRKRYR